MKGALKGMIVALANTVVVALMIASQQYHPSLDFAIMVVALCVIPATLVGAFAGHVAAALVHVHRGLVVAAMVALAGLCIFALASEYSAARDYIELAFLPTIPACVILERWTRQHLVLS